MKLFFVIFILSFLSILEIYAQANKCNMKFEASDLCAHVEFTGDISRKKPVSFEVQFYRNKTGKSVKLEPRPKVYLWMVMKNGHEHGSEPLKLKIKGTKYIYSNAWFLMLGQWYIKFELSGNNQRGKLPVCVKRGKNLSHLGKCN